MTCLEALSLSPGVTERSQSEMEEPGTLVALGGRKCGGEERLGRGGWKGHAPLKFLPHGHAWAAPPGSRLLSEMLLDPLRDPRVRGGLRVSVGGRGLRPPCRSGGNAPAEALASPPTARF